MDVAAGGRPQDICDTTGAIGGSWNRDGVIVFGRNDSTGIQRVSAAGGTPSPVTALNAERKDRYHAYPVFLPDGRHFLYLVVSTPEASGIYLGSLDIGADRQESKRLVATAFGASFGPSPDSKRGTILFQREGTLLAEPFDLPHMENVGEPVQVADQLGSARAFGFFSASDNGTLIYRAGVLGGNRQLGWFDRRGKNLGLLESRVSGSGSGSPRLSPDGDQVAAERTEGRNADIWLTSFSRGSDTRFTFDPGADFSPVWSPDGSRIAFSSSRGVGVNLYQHASNGAGQDELLFRSDSNKTVTDWSRDGRFLLYYDPAPKTGRDLWVLSMEGEHKPVPFLRTAFDESDGKFSPDTHWWRINPMSPPETRSTCGHSLYPPMVAENGWSRNAVEPSRTGALTAESCSISPWTEI